MPTNWSNLVDSLVSNFNNLDRWPQAGLILLTLFGVAGLVCNFVDCIPGRRRDRYIYTRVAGFTLLSLTGVFVYFGYYSSGWHANPLEDGLWSDLFWAGLFLVPWIGMRSFFFTRRFILNRRVNWILHTAQVFAIWTISAIIDWGITADIWSEAGSAPTPEKMGFVCGIAALLIVIFALDLTARRKIRNLHAKTFPTTPPSESPLSLSQICERADKIAAGTAAPLTSADVDGLATQVQVWDLTSLLEGIRDRLPSSANGCLVTMTVRGFPLRIEVPGGLTVKVLLYIFGLDEGTTAKINGNEVQLTRVVEPGESIVFENEQDAVVLASATQIEELAEQIGSVVGTVGEVRHLIKNDGDDDDVMSFLEGIDESLDGDPDDDDDEGLRGNVTEALAVLRGDPRDADDKGVQGSANYITSLLEGPEDSDDRGIEGVAAEIFTHLVGEDGQGSFRQILEQVLKNTTPQEGD